MAAIKGGIASSPIKTGPGASRPSTSATALATNIAISAGPESSCRLARVGGGLTSSRSPRGIAGNRRTAHRTAGREPGSDEGPGRRATAPRPGPECLQPALQKSLALLGALLALVLSLAEEVSELGVVGPLRVLDVCLEPEGVRQALLGEPDDVVVLVLGAGDCAGLGCGLHRCVSSSAFVGRCNERLPALQRG